MTAAAGVERVVLRAAVGNDNYADVEKLADILDGLQQRGVISDEGLTIVLGVLADEIVTQRIAIEFGSDLSAAAALADTHTPEDPST